MFLFFTLHFLSMEIFFKILNLHSITSNLYLQKPTNLDYGEFELDESYFGAKRIRR
jgi:hypothetical protein